MRNFISYFQKLKDSLQILRWVQAGLPYPPVPAVKRKIIKRLLQINNYRVFVETGTFKGDTLALISNLGLRTISIEISQEHFSAANQVFSSYKNVELHHGDAKEILPRIVASLNEPALFWLDSDYNSDDYNYKSHQTSSITSEIKCIIESPIAGHMILVDDAHKFTGENGYPELGYFLSAINNDGRYKAYIHCNIIILEPIK